MFNHTTRALRLGIISAAAVLIATVGAISSAYAYQTGYGPVQLVSMTSSATTQCPASDADAAISRGYAPEYPQIPLELGLDGTSLVTFTMALDGTASEVKLAGTSGNRLFDRAAVDAVQKSRFAPAIHNCSKIAGIYGVRVVFEQSPDSQLSYPLLPSVGSGGTKIK